MMKNNKGFTLVELLVVVLIIGILAAMAMPAYFKAVERSRAAEADTLIGSVVNAQARYKMKTGNFAEKWTSLDIAPQGAPSAAGYCTKGEVDKDKGCTGNGFLITLDGKDTKSGNSSGVKAERVGSGQYSYTLWKFYDSTTAPHCYATTTDDKEFCVEYTGIEDVASAEFTKAPFNGDSGDETKDE